MILVTILPTPALNQHGIMLAADMLQTIKHALGPGGTAGLHIALFWSEISPYPKSVYNYSYFWQIFQGIVHVARVQACEWSTTFHDQ